MAEGKAPADIVQRGKICSAPRDRPDARFYVGSGKIEELAALVEDTGADLILVSQSLSAVQERNIEKRCECRVLDRAMKRASVVKKPRAKPKPPRRVVEDLTEGRLAAELATWVRPVLEPTFLLSAVRKFLESPDDR